MIAALILTYEYPYYLPKKPQLIGFVGIEQN